MSIDLSKKYDLYRQDYCGCIYSLRDKEDETSRKI
ncbi:epoxyqueuosine reductase QueH [Citroniella saccharovorans]|uniref:Epoxyqueuosine reductase QueH n=1 Tax=Citroniella saccharovorans TaxID=2053367 RepID=A0AAW9MVW2_9FIRM|nr:epoxyqueuosine reductase QueH [Citroniella saccharovorans]MEB3430180.1 epoxyqueuosine reductase QueH [Citroniella saccharovorans]